MPRNAACLITLATLLAPGCTPSMDAPHDASATDAPLDARLFDAGPLDDGQIVATLHAIHAGQIELAHYAAAHSTNSDVVAFANDVASRYETADASLTSAASAAGVVATDNPASARQAALAGYVLDALVTAGCVGFDRTYVGNHLAIDDALGVVDANLLPAVTAAGIRDAISATRAILLFQQSATPGANPGFWDATVVNWEAGPYEDAGCAPVDAAFDVGTDA